MSTRSCLIAAASLFAGAGLVAGTAQAATLHTLTSDGMLTRVDSGTRRASRAVPISGADGRVLSIALRPANGTLYGLTDANQLVTIDPKTGRATPGAALDKPVQTGPRASINFNPVVDRLRVVGSGGGNFRINVDNGQVTADGGLKYADGTPLSGTSPMVTAAAYTNHTAGTKETALYTVDTMLSQINLQAPPNDGVQQPKKQLGTLPKGIGFDILADGQGGNTGFMVMDGKLSSLMVTDLSVRELGPVTGLVGEVVSLAAAK
ncbi:MAG: DUF4394 domain-containing protein [Gemmatimonadaceae bacterium]|nr:DUF4394 domain-containing protein [Acetobacteraceae bacterium]